MRKKKIENAQKEAKLKTNQNSGENETGKLSPTGGWTSGAAQNEFSSSSKICCKK